MWLFIASALAGEPILQGYGAGTLAAGGGLELMEPGAAVSGRVNLGARIRHGGLFLDAQGIAASPGFVAGVGQAGLLFWTEEGWAIGPAGGAITAPDAFLRGLFGTLHVEHVDEEDARWECNLGLGVLGAGHAVVSYGQLQFGRRTAYGLWMGAQLGVLRTGLEVGYDFSFGRRRLGER